MTQPSLLDVPLPYEPEPSPVAGEMTRRSAAQRRVVAYLKARGSATNVELCRPEVGGNRGIGRLWQAVQAGEIAVRKSHVKGGVWRYSICADAPLPR